MGRYDFDLIEEELKKNQEKAKEEKPKDEIDEDNGGKNFKFLVKKQGEDFYRPV